MATTTARKVSEFYREGNDWFCYLSLPSDITLVVDGVNFHLHKFPLISRCGRIAKIVEQSETTTDKTSIVLKDFPGGADTFFTVIKFCYSGQVSFTPMNIVIIYCASHDLDMTDDYGEDNLLFKCEKYFHKHILSQWKDCVLALQTCTPDIIPRADKLDIISRCLSTLSVMMCTDPSLFGWPMRMYGSMQSPGGSILWNGINTGAKLHSTESDWWFEDVSSLNVELFTRLIQTMQVKGIRPENIARTIMYYCEKHLPGLGQRWKGISRKAVSRKSVSSDFDQKSFLESVIKILPEKQGKSICRFLLGLLRVALILGVNSICQDLFERRVGVQLEFATLDSLLIPNYSDVETLYNTDCIERMIRHFVSSDRSLSSISPSPFDLESSPLSARLKRVAKLVDNYIAEVASDVNLKPAKMRSLAQALPESFRSLHDGLYRALDIYFKTHPWLSDKEREHLCSVIDFQKLSLDACSHASQNERLPLRIILQVLFFEQMQLRTALASYLQVMDVQSAQEISTNVHSGTAGQLITQQLSTVANDNEVLRLDMERMRSRVGELEEEFSRIKAEMKRVRKSHRSHTYSPRFVTKRIGLCKTVPPRSSDARPSLVESTVSTPTGSIEQPQQTSNQRSWQRRSSSFF